MKKVMPHIAAVFFALFGAGIVILLMSYTFQALARIFPDNFIAQLMGMLLFDVATFAWLGAFIYLSKAIMQYAFAFIGFLVGLAGTLGMVAIEVMLGGQTLMEPPAWVSEALVYDFIVTAVIHVVLFYAYKLSAPEISAEISLGVKTASITEEAMKQAESVLLAQRNALGSVIAPRLVNNVRQNLGLPITDKVLDLPAYDVAEPAPVHMAQVPQRKPGFWQRLKAAGQVLADGITAFDAKPVPPSPATPVQKTDLPQAGVPDNQYDLTQLVFVQHQAAVAGNLSNGYVIQAGDQIEFAMLDDGTKWVARKPGSDQILGEILSPDMMAIITGNSNFSVKALQEATKALAGAPALGNNGNGAHPT